MSAAAVLSALQHRERTQGVVVLFATLGPASDRQTHLYPLAAVSRLALQTARLDDLRKARAHDDVVAAMRARIAELAL